MDREMREGERDREERYINIDSDGGNKINTNWVSGGGIDECASESLRRLRQHCASLWPLGRGEQASWAVRGQVQQQQLQLE